MFAQLLHARSGRKSERAHEGHGFHIGWEIGYFELSAEKFSGLLQWALIAYKGEWIRGEANLD